MAVENDGANTQSLQLLIGDRVVSVTFIHDYMQIHFEHAYLNVMNVSTIVMGGVAKAFADVGYADHVRKLIGQEVRAVDVVSDAGINITFENDARFNISLHSQDYESGPEAALFQHDSGAWGVW